MADILVEDLTNNNGGGVLDKLIEAMRNTLQEEHKHNRVTGTEYSKVLVATLDSTMSNAIQFLLQKDIAAANVDLIKAQRELVITQEKAAQADILLTEAQTEKVNKEIELFPLQEELMYLQIALANAEVEKTHLEIEVLEVEKNKLVQEIELINAQTANAVKQLDILSAQLLNIPKEGQLLDKQVLKAVAETDFLTQRIKTEKAQILDIVDGVNVAGVIGKQKLLYQAQTDGFSRDAKFKFLSKMADTWTVRRSTDDGTVADSVNKLSDANIGAVIQAYATEVGITLP